MEALAIPIASFVLGAAGLMITVMGRISAEERKELVQLREDNINLRETIRRLRDENVYLQRKTLGLPTEP